MIPPPLERIFRIVIDLSIEVCVELIFDSLLSVFSRLECCEIVEQIAWLRLEYSDKYTDQYTVAQSTMSRPIPFCPR